MLTAAFSVIMRQSGTLFLIIALICAAIAGVGAMKLISASAPSVPVVVARADLEPGERLTAQKVKVVDMPVLAVPKDAIAGGITRALGKHVQTYIAAGDPIRKAHIAEYKNGGTAAARLGLAGHDLKGFALPPDATNGLSVEEGDIVDLIGVLKASSGNGQGQVKFIAEKAPVIDVTGNQSEDSGAPPEISVTIGLTATQAGEAAYYVREGSLVAVLVPPGS